MGEQGDPFSGSQLQRIDISRTLYKQAHVLVLDEVTSLFDNGTEDAVTAVVEWLRQDLTIVMIAHWLTTGQPCDLLIELAQGSLSADGPPQLVLAIAT